MKVEVLILLIIFLMFFFWSVWYRFSTKRLLKKYNPNNDKSKYVGELRDAKNEGREPDPKKAIINIAGSEQSSERPVLETTNSSPTGKDSKRVGGIFKRFRRK